MGKSTGIRPIGIQLTRLRSKIMTLFNSKDKSLVKLGQYMCHHYKISYWFTTYRVWDRYRSKIRGICVEYRLNNRKVLSGLPAIRDFQIKLYKKRKNGKGNNRRVR